MTTGGIASTNQEAEQISDLIQFAKTTYEENPTEALSALLEALTLNNGRDVAGAAIDRIKVELGPELATHIGDRNGRMEAAMAIIAELMEDKTTLLHEQDRQHILQQAFEDGSSVVCKKCGAMIPAARWQQHHDYWCEKSNRQDDNEMEEG
eukprot:CAMPEP_0195527820 /NCGR_PEP_ID=MMETSP0794_2-20130614/29742_1 /TAXON_ID=515487 /ORGANISM="Stephanopyxis turris, Strain CCMP 815" /LENGTH=150 /DNA_ID=CAMNT_0040658821 /DNA_START=100 /DNA_END=552 /DNA_ORIENTATION=-